MCMCWVVRLWALWLGVKTGVDQWFLEHRADGVFISGSKAVSDERVSGVSCCCSDYLLCSLLAGQAGFFSFPLGSAGVP